MLTSLSKGQVLKITGGGESDSLFPSKAVVRRRQWHPTPVLFPVLSLENPMDGGAWSAAVRGVTKSRTRLSDLAAAAAAKQ